MPFRQTRKNLKGSTGGWSTQSMAWEREAKKQLDHHTRCWGAGTTSMAGGRRGGGGQGEEMHQKRRTGRDTEKDYRPDQTVQRRMIHLVERENTAVGSGDYRKGDREKKKCPTAGCVKNSLKC